jgi:uncharacterized protein YceH (UPF0502 family)
VYFDALTGPEQRVLGCLIEKRFTTPDQYPLSVNSLRLAANQSTNRDPVVAYDENTVYQAAQRLCQYGLVRLASGHSSRSTKYRHLAEDKLALDREATAVLCVLLLRGPQTPGELKARTERMVALASLADVERILADLSDRDYVRRIGRRPGQKEDRFVQLLGGEGAAAADESPAALAASFAPSAYVTDPTRSDAPRSDAPRSDPPASAPELVARVSALEQEVAALRARLEELTG